MVDKAQWPMVDIGFVMVPLKLERSTGRPRVRRIKSSGETGKRGPYQCKRCFQFDHIEKICREPLAELGDELPPPPKTQREKERLPLQAPRMLSNLLQKKIQKDNNNYIYFSSSFYRPNNNKHGDFSFYFPQSRACN